MIGRILLAAVLAGLLAGLAMAVIQHVRLTPLIVQAETFEHTGHGHSGEAHGSGDQEWTPATDLERTAYTTLTVMVTGAGFALLLAALCILGNKSITMANAWVWGLCGFAAAAFAPAINLPPQLPGMGAIDFTTRQFLWLATVAATAGGLWFLAFAKSYGVKLAGLALLVLPQGYALPVPAPGLSALPAELATRFTTASLAANLVFWLLIAIFLAYSLKSFKVETAHV
jgi:cobalt transporter subunit CbtA